MTLDITQYGSRNVLWGRGLPIISLYDNNWELIDEWRFESKDNFRMNFRFLEVIDGKNEMEDGRIRKRVRGYRMYADFTIDNIENRDLLLFLRKMWTAVHIMITPHDGTMRNPNDNTYDFEMLTDSDFNPEYFDGRFIGHIIPFTLESTYLLLDIPEDSDITMIILATTYKEAGIEKANRRTSVTYWGEKMFYGGWELTEEDFKSVAFWEQPEDPLEICEYGKLW